MSHATNSRVDRYIGMRALREAHAAESAAQALKHDRQVFCLWVIAVCFVAAGLAVML